MNDFVLLQHFFTKLKCHHHFQSQIQNNKYKHIRYMNDVNGNFEMREVSVKLTSHDRNLSSFPILYDWTPG